MTAMLKDVFADTSFWIALVVRNDQHHEKARRCSQCVTGRIVTTVPVLLETTSALSRQAWRSHAIALVTRLQGRSDIQIEPLSTELWHRGWQFFCSRPDKAWSVTDCISFLVMQDHQLSDALTSDDHFEQAGFRAALLEPKGP